MHNHHLVPTPRCVDHPTDLLPLVGLTVEALLFGLFTLCMMVDQWDVVMTNLTHIDRLKGENHYHRGVSYGHQQQQHQGYGQLPQHMTPHYSPQHARNLMSAARAGVHEVFGAGRQFMSSSTLTYPTTSTSAATRFHYTWLSPLHKVCFPETVRDDIFGYCRPCSSSRSSSPLASSVDKGGRRISKGLEMVGRGSGDNNGRSGTIGAAEIV